MPTLSRLAAAGSAALLTAGALTSLATAAQASTVDTTVHQLTTQVVPGLSKLTDLGAISDGQKLTVGVSIPGDTAAINAAYLAMTTKGNVNYGVTYTPASFAAAFGVDPAVSAAVQKTVEADGLTPVYVAKDGQYVELSGTAAQVEKTFSVSIHNFLVNGKTYFANTTGATVPTAVSHVAGLTSFDVDHTHDSQGTCLAATCTGVAGPSALWGAYDQPDTYAEGQPLKATEDYGQGQKVAIFGEGDLKQVVTDLRNFEDDTDVNGDTADLKPQLPHIPVRETLVADDQSDTSGLGEWDLDSQSSTGMSPDLAELQFYFGQDLSDASIEGIYSAWVNDADGAAIGNSSFGGCEPLEGALGDEAVDDTYFKQAVMMGRTMFTSTGDTGSGGCVVAVDLNGLGNGGAPAIEYPSASPYVVAVGGTVLYTAADSSTGNQAQPVVRGQEYSWTYTGGGYSLFEAMPADQTAMGNTLPATTPCVGDNTGVGGTPSLSCRQVPDVSAMSGDVVTNGYGIETGSTAGKPGSGESETGGTSLSSPLWAGMWARVRAAHPVTCLTYPGAPATGAGSLGFAQQLLYAVAESNQANDNAAFFDIGGTTESQPGTSLPAGNGTYTPLPRTPVADPTGFDLTSGLGTPDLSAIIKILDCNSTAPTSTAVPNSDTVTIINFTPANGCPPNGTATDPAGDETSGDKALDLITGDITSNSSGITFATNVTALPETAAGQSNDYLFNFTYGGTQYIIDANNGSGTTAPTYELESVGTVNTTNLAALSGSFTNGTPGTISAVLPYSTFNSTAKPATALAPGATLSSITVDSETTTDQLDYDDTMTYACSYDVAGDVTIPPALPDASVPVALLGVGLLAGGAFALRRRRTA